jgi:glycosyltransferase involved in cell wall biosynthesis
LRILIAHSFYRVPGGEDRYVSQQLELLGVHHEVELLARHNEKLANGPGAAMKMAMSFAELRAVQAQMERFGPDVIHLHNPYPALGPAVHLAAERLGIPLVMTVHNLRLRCPNGLMFTEGGPCRRCEGGNYLNATLHHCFPSTTQAGAYATVLWIHRFLLRLEGKTDVFVTPSDFLRNRLQEWGIAAKRVETIRNFIPLTPGASAQPGNAGVYIGRLSSEKGLDILLRALALAGDPPFLIVGSGPLEKMLASLAAQLGLRQTRFTGWVSPVEVGTLLRDARFLTMPSLCDDNAPLAVLEGMAAGRPVLVSRRGGLPELVAEGAGLVCEPGDAKGLSDKIRELMGDDGLCREMGNQGIRTVGEKYSADLHRAGLELVYRRLISAGKST